MCFYWSGRNITGISCGTRLSVAAVCNSVCHPTASFPKKGALTACRHRHFHNNAVTTTPYNTQYSTQARRHAGTQASQQGEPRTNEQRSRGLILIAGCRGLANRGSLFRRAYLAPRCHGVVVWIAVACGTVASPGWHVRWQWAQWSMVQSSIRKRVVLIKGCIASNPTVPEL